MTQSMKHSKLTYKPSKKGVTTPYKKTWNNLSIADNRLILLKAGRIMIPNNQRKAIYTGLATRLTHWNNSDNKNGQPAILLARDDRKHQRNDQCMQTLTGAMASTTKTPTKADTDSKHSTNAKCGNGSVLSRQRRPPGPSRQILGIRRKQISDKSKHNSHNKPTHTLVQPARMAPNNQVGQRTTMQNRV